MRIVLKHTLRSQLMKALSAAQAGGEQVSHIELSVGEYQQLVHECQNAPWLLDAEGLHETRFDGIRVVIV